MESTKYKTGSFSAGGAYSDRKLTSLVHNMTNVHLQCDISLYPLELKLTGGGSPYPSTAPSQKKTHEKYTDFSIFFQLRQPLFGKKIKNLEEKKKKKDLQGYIVTQITIHLF